VSITPATVDDYIASFPPATGEILERIRQTMHDAVAGLGEKISYGIAAMTLDGHPLVYFAGWKAHVSVYPLPAGDAELEATLAPYRSGASTARFLLAKPIPYELIAAITSRLAVAHRTPPASPA
jgi:uncharacterized protein YdhG (YjbR/CyaY superfamily)